MRLEIARILDVHVQRVQLLSSQDPLNDNQAVLSEVLASSDEQFVIVVVINDPRLKLKVDKLEALIKLGEYDQARELLDVINSLKIPKSVEIQRKVEALSSKLVA